MNPMNPSPEAQMLLAELRRVPDDQLPADTRAALAEAIRCGEVDALYTPLGGTVYNVCFAAMPHGLDPRMKLTAWVAAWQAGVAPYDAHLAALRAQQRQREQEGGAR